jgi:hypothetical protein
VSVDTTKENAEWRNLGESPFGTLDYDAITKSVFGLGESDAGRRTLVSVDVLVRYNFLFVNLFICLLLVSTGCLAGLAGLGAWSTCGELHRGSRARAIPACTQSIWCSVHSGDGLCVDGERVAHERLMGSGPRTHMHSHTSLTMCVCNLP